MQGNPNRPPGPRAVLLLRRHPETFLKLARKYGDVVYFTVGPREVLLVSRPDLVESIHRQHYAHSQRDWGPQRGSTAFGNGLFTAEGDDHRAQRQVFSRLFARPSIEARKPVVTDAIEAWSERHRDGEEIDLLHEMSVLMTEISSRVLFGCVTEGAATVAATTKLNGSFSRVMFPYADRFRRKRDLGQPLAPLIAYVKKHGTEEGLLAPMLNGDAQADQQLATFIVTGQESLRLATTWTWILLSKHRHVRERFLDDPSPRFIDQVLNESMRLYPPQWMIGRKTITPYPLDGFEVPRRSLVLTCPYVVHRDPRYFDDPLRFNPARWEGMPPVRGAYFPFGGGPRRCIGESFALIVGNLVLASLAKRWIFDCSDHDPSYDVRLTLAPRGVKARLRRVNA
jgi:cytochrome P450